MESPPDILSLLVGDTTEDTPTKGYKLQIPQQCTTCPNGPLNLASTNNQLLLYPTLPSTSQSHGRHSSCSSLPPLPLFTSGGNGNKKDKINLKKSKCLTRFPVAMVRRPIEEAADQMKEINMSTHEFQENIKHLKVRRDVILIGNIH